MSQAKEFRKRMIDLDCSQQKLIKLTGLSQFTLSRYLGDHLPKTNHTASIERKIDIALKEFELERIRDEEKTKS